MVTKTPRQWFQEVFEPAGGWRDQADLDKAIKRVSPTQLDVVAKLAETGSFLMRVPGGFWTYDGCGMRGYSGIPTWWTTTRTVQAMERRRLLIRSWYYTEDWRDHRELNYWGTL